MLDDVKSFVGAEVKGMVAASKSVVAGSDKQLTDAVRKALGKLGGTAHWEAQILGAGCTAGKRHRWGASAVLRKRFAATAERIGRYERLAAAAKNGSRKKLFVAGHPTLGLLRCGGLGGAAALAP